MGNSESKLKSKSKSKKQVKPFHCVLIRRNLTELCERIDIIHSGLYEKLLEKGALEREDVTKIKKSNAAGSLQVAALLEFLEQKPLTVFIKFKESLIETGQGYIVTEILESTGCGDASDLSRWQSGIALRYNRTLHEFPLYELTDDPRMVSLRLLYTRTDITDTTGWPPTTTYRMYQDYASLFIKDKNPRKRVLLLGSPGMGKSILGHQMALDWSDLVNKTEPIHNDQFPENTSYRYKEETEFLKCYSLLLHVDLSRIRPNSSLIGVISEQILVDEREHSQWFIDYVTLYQEKCLIILDGWDEYDPSSCPEVTDIANGQSFSGATVLISSRIREHTVLPKATDAQCMIKGFNQDQANEFVTKVLTLSGTASSNDALVTFVTGHYLWGVFCVPLMLTYLCLLYISGSNLMEKVTDLFHSIIKLTLGRHKLKNMKVPAADIKVTLIEFSAELSNLGKLAYSGLENNNTKTVFTKDEATENGGETNLHVGLLHKVRSQDLLSSSCLLTFGHKSIQEFVAAIYLTNTEAAFNEFYVYLDSLIKVYDSQLLVTFICGLNPDCGRQLLPKIQEISKTDTATAAQCPEFSDRGWQTEKPGVIDIAWRQVTIASDVTPFLIQCCWEMTQKDRSITTNIFPFIVGSDKSAVKLHPHINMKLINIYYISYLLKNAMVSFIGGDQIKLYNLSNKKENEKNTALLLDHISQNLEEITTLDITNIKSDTVSGSLTALFSRPYDVIMMNTVDLLTSDMLKVVNHLSYQQAIVVLSMIRVSVTGCEEALCDALTHLNTLRALYLKFLSLPGHEAQLCDAISHLQDLHLLHMYNTDMSGAGDALIECCGCLNLLIYLDLADTKLTEDQTKRVVLLLPSCPGLLLLSLDGLPVVVAVEEMKDVLPLTKLRVLNVMNGGMSTEHLVSSFTCLPPSLKAFYAGGNDTQNGIVSISQTLPSLSALQYLSLDLSQVTSENIQQLRAACQQTGVVLITNNDEYMQHGAGIAQITGDVRKKCE